jgi:hypothetical protein
MVTPAFKFAVCVYAASERLAGVNVQCCDTFNGSLYFIYQTRQYQYSCVSRHLPCISENAEDGPGAVTVLKDVYQTRRVPFLVLSL